MNLFETTILLEKMHLSTFKKSHFLPQLEVLRAIHVPSIFWVATPEVKTRNATARAQEKKVSGPGNRIARSMAVWSCSWNPEKWSYSSWLRDYLVITNCYIPFFNLVRFSELKSYHPTEPKTKSSPTQTRFIFFSKESINLVPIWATCAMGRLSGNRVVPASWSSRHRSHRWWDWSEPCLLPARCSGSKTRALRLQIDAKVFLTLPTLAPNEVLESLDTLPMSANKNKLEVGNFSTFRFKQKTILSIQLCSVSLETSTLGSMWSPWNWESGRRPNFLLLFLIFFILPDLHSFQKQASVVTS